MRLILMGQKAFGRSVLAKLVESSIDEVVAVYCEPDNDDQVKEYALNLGLPVHQPTDFNDSITLERLKKHDADLMIMAFVNVFVPQTARDTPRMGSICFHPSLLPLHRGPSAVNWPIIFGAIKSGYSWFYPTDDLDQGDCLLQWECEISLEDTVIDLYFKKIFPSAVESILTVCDLFRSGSPPRVITDGSMATYEPRCKEKHAKIDWNKPVKQVYDLIRGTNPEPGAWTTLNGRKVQIYDCCRLLGDGNSAKIIRISEDGVTVQLIGGRIKLIRVRPAGGSKIPATEWARSEGLSVGDILGT